MPLLKRHKHSKINMGSDAPNQPKKISTPARLIFTSVFVVMIAVAIGGGYATYQNMTREFGNSATAIGLVAAGEGATSVLGLTLVGLTLISRPYPPIFRAALWLIPLTGSAVGYTVAESPRMAVVYSITPMATTVAAETLGYLAREIVVHVNNNADAESARRNAHTINRIAYHRARAENHHNKTAQWLSRWIAWHLVGRAAKNHVPTGQETIQTGQNHLSTGADGALADMLHITPGALTTKPKDKHKDKELPAPDNPGHQPDSTPDNVTDTPDNVTDTSDSTPDTAGHSTDNAPDVPDSSTDTVPDTVPEEWSQEVRAADSSAEAVRILRDKGCSREDTIKILSEAYPDWSADRLRKAMERNYDNKKKSK